MTTKRRLLLLLPVFLVPAFGCPKSQTPATLSGTVKYNGQLVTAGTIRLEGKEGGFHSIDINPDGTYASSNLPVGTFDVTIETESANPAEKPSPDQYGGFRAGKDRVPKSSPRPEDAPATGKKGAYMKISEKYSSKETSRLSVTLTRGKNTKDFELTGE
jgi:hypothetical protein